jgi:hypothetical protein
MEPILENILSIKSFFFPCDFSKGKGVHYEIIVEYSKPHLFSFLPNYSWFMQYMKNDNGESGIINFL